MSPPSLSAHAAPLLAAVWVAALLMVACPASSQRLTSRPGAVSLANVDPQCISSGREILTACQAEMEHVQEQFGVEQGQQMTKEITQEEIEAYINSEPPFSKQ